MSSHIDNHLLSRLISGHLPAVDWTSFSSVDWTLLFQAAQWEGVGPLLYWRLSKSGKFASLPEEVQDTLRSMYVHTRSRNQKIFKELEDITRLFHVKGIPAMALKGVCFALTIYPDIGLRPMNDIDILVPKTKLVEAVNIAKTLGYEERARPVFPPKLGSLDHIHILLQKSGNAAVLELHHCLVASEPYIYSVPMDWFWEQTEALGGDSQMRFKDLRMLTPTAQVLYAASHAMLQHGEEYTTLPLRWFYDMDQLVRLYAERVDWGLLISQSRLFEWGFALEAALSQTQAYFKTPIPDHVHACLSEKYDRSRKIILLKQTRPLTYIHGIFLKLSALNAYEKLRLIVEYVVPNPAYMRWRYHFNSPWVLPTYYLFHWWKILKNVPRIASLFLKRLSEKWT